MSNGLLAFVQFPWLENCCVYVLLVLQVPKTGKGKKAALPVNKDRFISKIFLRGNRVIIVLRDPK
jgi:hypothetical protein